MRKLLIAVLSIVALSAQGQAPNEARLVGQSGGVEVQRGTEWVPASPGEVLSAGVRVRTGAGSSAAIEVSPNKVITMNPGTEVQVRQWNGAPMVQLETGSIKVLSASEAPAPPINTIPEDTAQPWDQPVDNSAVIVDGSQDSTDRIYNVGGSANHGNENVVTYPDFYVYPYFYGNPYYSSNPRSNGFRRHDPNLGRIVPPVVNNPTNPGYRPNQIVPPMSDPIHVPVQPPVQPPIRPGFSRR